jgi:hypothetical protein
MTILCSLKVTQHHCQVNGILPPGNAILARGQVKCDPPRAAALELIPFT